MIHRADNNSGLFDEIIVDCFAGGGGASLGIESAIGGAVDVAINHDEEAVALHRVNHPHTFHLCGDIFDQDPIAATAGRPVGFAWFSPDCTYFSKARGAKPIRDKGKKSRGLAWVVLQWASKVRPRIIMLENVEEFQKWGPLDRDGKPCRKRIGKTFRQWTGHLRNMGYSVSWRELRACDYGSPTIRKRLFLIARCDGLPIVWPKATHGSKPGMKPYRTAAECIDWSIPCPSIFERKKPLAENTLRRIANGIRRFVIETNDPVIIRVDDQSTISAIAPSLISIANYSKNGVATSNNAHAPLTTITANPKGGHHALVVAFLAKHFGGMTGVPIDTPLPTTTTKATQNQIVECKLIKQASFLTKFRGTCRDGQRSDQPMPTITAGGNHLAEVRAFLIKYYGNERDGASLCEPMHTIPTRDRFGLVKVQGVPHRIIDIGMRMLTPRELYRAQGFPDSYIIAPEINGKHLTKSAQVRMCGNSVCPQVAECLVKANISVRSVRATRCRPQVVSAPR